VRTALFLLATAGLAAGACAVSAFVLVPDGSADPQTLAGIVVPAAAVWLMMAFYIIKQHRRGATTAKDLGAQLMRREIELGRTSTVDELTGLATRREFDAMVRLEYGRFQRHGHPTSLLMVEIDDIGELGEQLGPITKGLAVSELASILKQTLRTIDLGCRFTDSSLAMLLLETTGEQSSVVTDRIRAAVEAHTFLSHRSDGRYKLTVSQGVAQLDGGMASHVDFVRAAEQALAEARTIGRDQVNIRAAA
jgi:diguanylate cyclase (GGDEF)-like protein